MIKITFIYLVAVTLVLSLMNLAHAEVTVGESFRDGLVQSSRQSNSSDTSAVVSLLDSEMSTGDGDLLAGENIILNSNEDYKSIGWKGNGSLQNIARKVVEEQKLDELQVRDIGNYCPKYNQLSKNGKKMFWSVMLFAISLPESDMRSHLSYTESFSDTCKLSNGSRVSGRVVSRGLLQVSACSCHYYGEKLTGPGDLHKPESNLSCGARVIKRLVGRHGVIKGKSQGKWKGASAYWSVFRKTSTINRIKKTIKETFVDCF